MEVNEHFERVFNEVRGARWLLHTARGITVLPPEVRHYSFWAVFVSLPIDGRGSFGKSKRLRWFLSKNIPACLSFCPASALQWQLHSSLCACHCALNLNKITAQSGIFFSGNHLKGKSRNVMESGFLKSRHRNYSLTVAPCSTRNCNAKMGCGSIIDSSTYYVTLLWV